MTTNPTPAATQSEQDEPELELERCHGCGAPTSAPYYLNTLPYCEHCYTERLEDE